MSRFDSSENLNRFSHKRFSCRVPSRNVQRNDQVGTVDAILSGSTDALARALKSGSDPNETDKDGVPAIFLTLEKSGRPDMLRLLLEHRADPDAPQSIVKRTCLHAAAKLGYQLCVATLLNYGADAGKVDFKGNTALMHAARNGHAPVVRLLARHEADHGSGKGSIADIANLRGETALHAAVESGDLETVRLLTRGAVDLNLSDNTGKTPFLLACRLNNLPVAEVLLEESYKEIDINAREPDTGRTSLFWAVLHANAKLVQLLLSRGAEVDVPDKEWQTPFLLAVRRGGDELIMKLLLDAGCNAAVTDRSFNTALHHAASEGIAESLPLLIRAGLDPNIKGACGLTALMLASYRGHLDVVKLLLAFGSNPDLQDRLHCSAIAYALIGEAKKLPSYASPKHDTGNHPVLQCIKALIRANCSLDTGNGFKRLCLCYSIELANRHVEDLEDEKLYSPLEIAFLRNNVDAFRILIQAGCDLQGFTLNAKDISKCKDKTNSSTMFSLLITKRKMIRSLKVLCRKPALTNLQLQGIPISEVGNLDLPDDILDLLTFKDLDAKLEDETTVSYMDKINSFNSIINSKNKLQQPIIQTASQMKSTRQVHTHATPLPAKQEKINTHEGNYSDQDVDSAYSSSFKRTNSMRPTKLPVVRNKSNPGNAQQPTHPTQREPRQSLSRSNSVRTLRQSQNSPGQQSWGYGRQPVTRTRTTSSGSEDSAATFTQTFKPNNQAGIVGNNEHHSLQVNSPVVGMRSQSSTGLARQQRHSLMLEDDYTRYKQSQQADQSFAPSYGRQPSNRNNTDARNPIRLKDGAAFSSRKVSNFSTESAKNDRRNEAAKNSGDNDIDELIARYRNRFKGEDTSSFYERQVDSKLNQTDCVDGDFISNSSNNELDDFSLNDGRDVSDSLADDVFSELEKRKINRLAKIKSAKIAQEKDTYSYADQSPKIKLSLQAANNYNYVEQPTNPMSPRHQKQNKSSVDAVKKDSHFDDYISQLYDRYQMIKKASLSEDSANNNNITDICSKEIKTTARDVKIDEHKYRYDPKTNQSTASAPLPTNTMPNHLKFNAANCKSLAEPIQQLPATRNLKKSTVVISSVLPPPPASSYAIPSAESKDANISNPNKDVSDNLSSDNYQNKIQTNINFSKQTPYMNIQRAGDIQSADRTIKSNFVRSVSTPENRRYASLRASKTKYDSPGGESGDDLSGSADKKSSFKLRLRAIKESVQPSSHSKTKQPIMQNFLLR